MGEILKRYKGSRFLGYYLRFYEDGRRRIMASKQASYTEARRMLLEIEARIARGEAGVTERPVAVRLDELVERFLTEYSRPRIKDLKRYRTYARVALGRVVAVLGQPIELTGADVARAREQLRRRYSSASVRLSLSFLSTMFGWAVRTGLAKANPCRGVERPETPHSIDFLSRDEVDRLLQAAEAQATNTPLRVLHLAVALALHTGLRKGELLGLRWCDLDVETRRLTVARSYDSTTKSGKVRHLRLPLSLVSLFREWRRDCPSSPDGSVFPIGRPYRVTVKSSNAMLGLPKLWARVGLRPAAHPWHLLRHTMASHFVMAGGSMLALQKILGHADPKQTLAYAHLAPDYLGEELDRVKF